MADLVAMSRRIADLEEEIKALREALKSEPVNLHIFLGLSVAQSRVMNELERVSPNVVTHSRILSILDSQRVDSDQYAKVIVCAMNRKLRLHGVVIRNVWGQGYFIDRSAKTLLDALLDEVAAREGFDRTTVPWRARD